MPAERLRPEPVLDARIAVISHQFAEVYSTDDWQINHFRSPETPTAEALRGYDLAICLGPFDDQIGLGFGFAGSMLLFLFGVPRYPSRADAGKSALLLEETDADEIRSVYRADRLGKAGAALIALAFAIRAAALL